MFNESGCVIQICLSPAWGGLEMSALDSARIFADAGFRSILVCSPETPLAERAAGASGDGIEVRTLKSRKYLSPSATLKLRALIGESGPRAVIVHRLRDLWIVRPALLGHIDVRLIGFARMQLSIFKRDLLHRFLYSRVDELIALSAANVAHLAERLPVPIERIKVIPNGVDTRRFSPEKRSEEIRRELGCTQSDLLIGCMGRIDRQKGQRELLDAVAQLRAKRPGLRFRLVFAGARTMGEADAEAYENELFAARDRLGLTSHVVFAGHRDDAEALSASFDIQIVPSYEETFGRVVIEAMASGTAVVATEAGGVPDLIRHGRDGWLAKPRDAGSLAEAIEALATDSALRARIAANGRESVLKRFSRDSVRDRILALAAVDSKTPMNSVEIRSDANTTS